MKIHIRYYILIGITIFFVNSCTKEISYESNTKTIFTSKIFKSKSSEFNILVFNNDQELYRTLFELDNKDDNFLNYWEDQQGFFSMRRAFDKITNDELKFSENLELQHSELIKNYPNSIVVEQLYDNNDTCGFYDKNIHSDYLSKIVNPDGLVIVGGLIYQHTKDYIKIIKDGDPNKISYLINATKSNPELGIEVIYLNSDTLKSGTSTFHRENQKNDGRLKVVLYEDFIQNSSGSQKATTYRIRVRSLQRRLFGLWYDNYNANISLSGSVYGNATEGWLNDNRLVLINWTGSYSISSSTQTHTFDRFIPIDQMLQSNPGLRTVYLHPEIYKSSHTATANRSGKTATCNTSYP